VEVESVDRCIFLVGERRERKKAISKFHFFRVCFESVLSKGDIKLLVAFFFKNLFVLLALETLAGERQVG
jgi:hypothetical protein